MIQIQDLSYSYEKDSPLVLRGINMEIEQGSWLALIGPNGSGKSTLARQLNGLLLPRGGKVLVDGLDTAEAACARQVREKVSFVFQNPDNQFVASSVEEDIAFGPENLGLSNEEITDRVEQAITALDLSDLRYESPHLLSGGEKQRVALAGALAMCSSYLVLDEPTSMLDPQMRRSVLEYLHKIHSRRGLGIIYVTNIMEEAVLADQIAVLDQGCLVRVGTPTEIFGDAEFIKSHGLELPSARKIASMLEADGFSGFASVLDHQQLMEKVLCAD